MAIIVSPGSINDLLAPFLLVGILLVAVAPTTLFMFVAGAAIFLV